MLRLTAAMLLLPFAASSVLVFKCCNVGNSLDPTGQCVPNKLESSWAPVVYDPAERNFFPPGSVPDSWEFLIARPQDCSNPQHLYNSSPPSYVVFVNGSALIPDVGPNFLQSGTFCVDSTGLLACLPGAGGADPRPSVRKCCGPKAAYSDVSDSCVADSRDDPFFDGWKTLSGFPVCTEVGSYDLGGKLNDTHFLGADGILHSSGHTLTTSQYCLERLHEHPERPLHVFTCPPRSKFTRKDDIKFTLYPVGLFLSVFFLAVTLIASCLLPSTYHVLHWRCQTNHVACLLIGDLLLAITQLSGQALQGPGCIGIAIAMHFFFLAAFFWLNTMCFNIWWTFRDLRPASLDKGQEACRLRLYELYAWGCPLVISGLAALVDNLPEQPAFLRPRFGEQRCWFYGDSELLYYFFGPIGALLIINLTLFAMTARELTCGLWKTEVVKSNTERAALGRVCLKLVVVMGITWVADVVSWVVGGPDYVWFLTDLVNALQGVLIFAVVGCQPQVWAAVKRLWCLRDSPTAHVRSSSSHALPSIGSDQTTTSITKPVETLC